MSGKPSGEIVLYPRGDGAPALEMRLDGDTVWLTQAQMADLFQTTPQNITLHLKSIFADGELNETATCKDHLQVRREGARQISRFEEGELLPERAMRKFGIPEFSTKPTNFYNLESAYLDTLKLAQRKLEGKRKKQ